jgi:raffinose/stachyose/melibiose transport system permease protein
MITILLVGGLIAPVQLIGIQLLQLVKTLHIFDTYFSLILPYTAFGTPLAVLILTGFFRQVPKELPESARIDGANEFQVFVRIMLPLARPALATIVIFTSLFVWNDFFLPLVLAYTPSVETLQQGVEILFGAYSTDWGIVFAAVMISALPVIIGYVFLSRHFISGLTRGAVKG